MYIQYEVQLNTLLSPVLGLVYSLLLRVLLTSINEQAMKKLSHVTNHFIDHSKLFTLNASCHCIWLENPIGMAAFSRQVNYTNNLMKSTIKKGVIACGNRACNNARSNHGEQNCLFKCFISQFEQYISNFIHNI